MADGFGWSDVVVRGLAADDIYSEIGAIIVDMRKQNALMSGDDRQLRAMICGHLGLIAVTMPYLPIQQPRNQKSEAA